MINNNYDNYIPFLGHYDASFESEVPPMGLSMEKDNNGITGGIGIIGNNTTCSNSITTAGTNNTILPPKVCMKIDTILHNKLYTKS